jgi:hypothetical protein
LVSAAAYQKGETILEEIPIAFHDDVRLKRRCLLCAHCGARAGSLSANFAILRGKTRRAACSATHTREIPALDESSEGATVVCGEGCDDIFCSDVCQVAGRRTHAPVCGHSDGLCGELSCELRRHAKRGELDALLITPKLVVRASDDRGALNLARELSAGTIAEKSRGEIEEAEFEELEEAVSLGIAALQTLLEVRAKDEGAKASELVVEAQTLLAPSVYAALLRGWNRSPRLAPDP